MAISVDYMHICDYAFVGENGKPGFIGVFDNINAVAVPVTMTVHVGIRLLGNPNEAFDLTVEVGKPNGEVLFKMEPKGRVGHESTGNIGIAINGLQFPDFGRYTLRVISGKETLVSQSLRVQKVQAPPRAAAAH